MTIVPPDRLGDGPVVLRALRADDAPAYAGAFTRDPDLARLLGVARAPDEQSVRERIAQPPQEAGEGRAIELAIADPATDAFWGTVLLHSFDDRHRRCEIGFWVTPEHRRRGVGRAAVSVALAWAFGELDLLRVEMTTTPENTSVPGLARRLGFTPEGVLRARNIEFGRRVDIVWFGLLREEWSGA
jgi:ribosomal-protein-alanine N-acetyltransferase